MATSARRGHGEGSIYWDETNGTWVGAISLSWSAFWDKRDGVWRVSENDPDSDLYAESREADVVIQYMAAHS
jgi:hypothetical protein